MGTGNHEYGYCQGQSEEAFRASEAVPITEGHRGQADGDEGEVRGRAIRQLLHRRFRLLGLPDQVNDLREGRLLTSLRHLNPDGTLPVHGSSDDLVALGLGHGLGFTRHHGLV